MSNPITLPELLDAVVHLTDLAERHQRPAIVSLAYNVPDGWTLWMSDLHPTTAGFRSELRSIAAELDLHMSHARYIGLRYLERFTPLPSLDELGCPPSPNGS